MRHAIFNTCLLVLGFLLDTLRPAAIDDADEHCADDPRPALATKEEHRPW